MTRFPRTALPILALLACQVVALPAALAAGPFDGTWRVPTDTIQQSGPPDSYALKDGSFTCNSCKPPYTVKADGNGQIVAGQNYYDSIAVKVIDPQTVRFIKMQGAKMFSDETLVVSGDGKRLDEIIQDMSGATVATWNQESARVADGAPGSHAVAGAWKVVRIAAASDAGTTVKYRMTDDGLQMDYNGMRYDARFDGKPVAMQNDPGKTGVSLRRLSRNVVEETDTREGKVTAVTTMTVSEDGKSMEVVMRSPGSDAATRYTLVKQ